MLVASCVAAATLPPAASAYSHNQACHRVPYDQCFDVRGQIYNPWYLAQTSTDDLQNVPGICAKARSAAGTTKSGSGCSINTWQRTSYFAATPESQAYGYWGDGGCTCSAARYFHVYAET